MEDALDAMANGDALALCGGTDIFPAHVGRPVTRPIVDVSAVAELRGVSGSQRVIL